MNVKKSPYKDNLFFLTFFFLLQRLSSQELKDVLTPEPPEVVSHNKFVIHWNNTTA